MLCMKFATLLVLFLPRSIVSVGVLSIINLLETFDFPALSFPFLQPPLEP